MLQSDSEQTDISVMAQARGTGKLRKRFTDPEIKMNTREFSFEKNTEMRILRQQSRITKRTMTAIRTPSSRHRQAENAQEIQGDKQINNLLSGNEQRICRDSVKNEEDDVIVKVATLSKGDCFVSLSALCCDIASDCFLVK